MENHIGVNDPANTIPSIDFPSQSPLYYAANRDRYERQQLIKEIEALIDRRIVVYIANLNHPQSSISKNDIPSFSDACYDIPRGSKVDLVIHSGGGDPNAAEQLVNILLSKTDDLRVVVPQSAKSAATMITLVADEILMSDSSELGPIDPQIAMPTQQGFQHRPANALLNGLDDIQKAVTNNNGRLNAAYYPILQGIDPSLIHFCKQAIEHSKNLAEKWLLRSMCQNDPAVANSIAEQLVDISKYPNHGQVINWKEARDIGLNVTYMPLGNDVWEAYWRLFCLYDAHLKAEKLVKIFEGARGSVRI